MSPFIEQDAREWLAGGDPFAARKNYSLAKRFADAKPGHDFASTMHRIRRKLGQKRGGRRDRMLITAMELTRNDYPFALHLRALDELAKEDTHPVWKTVGDMARRNIADYEAKWGKPDASLNIKQIEEGARKSLELPISLSALMAGEFEMSPLAKILKEAVEQPGAD